MPGVPLPRKYRQAQIDQAVAGIPAAQRAAIGNAAIASQKAVLAFPYWSTVRFLADNDGMGTFTLAANTSVTAFNYAIGQDASPAGFAAPFPATRSETNLLQASQTRDNADLLIFGIAAELCSNSDATLAQHLWRFVALRLQLSGTDGYDLGVLAHFPGGGGLYGQGIAGAILPGSQSVVQVGSLSNGNPMAGSYYKFPAPLLWQAVGGGRKDTSLVVTCTNTSAFSFDGDAAMGQTLPDELIVDVRFRLISTSVSERSANQ